MKKNVLVVLVTAMLLTNVAFASTHTKNAKDSTMTGMTQNNVYNMCTQDAH